MFLILRLLQYFLNSLLSNCSPFSNTKASGTPNLVMMFFHTNFFAFTSWMFAKASYLLGEVIGGHDHEPSIPCVSRKRTHDIQSPQGEGLWTGNQVNIPPRLMDVWGMLLALVISLYIICSISLHVWPPKALRYHVVRERPTFSVATTNPFMQFDE